MPVINLIQEQRLALHRLEQRSRIAFLTLIGAAVTTALGYGILMFQGQALHAQIGRLDLELQKLSPIVAQIEENDKEQAVLKPRLQTLQQAQEQSDRWAHILQHLRTQTPADTWLTAMQATALQQDKPTSIVIQGVAQAQEPIGEFILRVENEPDLENVSLHFTQEKRGPNGPKAIDFEMAADLAGSAEQKQAVKEEGKS